MIIVRIKCGLGNQLFQYAAARALAAKLDQALYADIRWFQEDNRKRITRDKRCYLLPELGCALPLASPSEVDAFYPKWWTRWTGRPLPPGILLLQENGETLLEEFHRVDGPVCLDGYWQGEAYFEAAKTVLATHLLGLRPRAFADAWLGDLQVPGTAAVHVRRGDYANSKSLHSFFARLDFTYYSRALDALGAERALVFSDDIPWCRAHFQVGRPLAFVEPPPNCDSSMDQLLCLGFAKKLVIANSTFSWWAGWLAAQRSARVIGPARWFLDPRYAKWEELLKTPHCTWI
jgi:hypothetical protein